MAKRKGMKFRTTQEKKTKQFRPKLEARILPSVFVF